MNRGTDKKYSDMIHAYELGLLDEADTQSFELHLYECDHCYQQVREFSSTSALIRQDAELRRISESSASYSEKPVLAGKTNWRRLLIPATPVILALLILILLVILPGRLNIEYDGELQAGKNKVLVPPFTDLSDNDEIPRFGDVIASLLITDLSNSRQLNIVSTVQFLDALNIIGYDLEAAPEKVTALEVAGRTKAHWIVSGTIAQTDPEIVISFEIVEQSTGEIFASERIFMPADQGILTAVDSLSLAVKKVLLLPEKLTSEFDSRVANVTTASPKAFYYYLLGLEKLSKYRNAEAVEYFENALEYDSTFAMAYFYLAKLKNRRLIDEAVRYSENTTRRERLMIKGSEAAYSRDYATYEEILKEITRQFPDEKTAYRDLGLFYYRAGQFQLAINYLNESIKLDSLYKSAYNSLAYAYSKIGNYEDAISSLNSYLRLAPNEANPYDTRGDIYGNAGEVEKAIESYRQALKKDPEFYASLLKLAHLYIYLQDYSQADSCYSAYAAISVHHAREIIPFATLTHLFRGQLSQALEILDSIIQVYQDIDDIAVPGYLYRQKALVYLEKKEFAEAIRAFNQAMAIYDNDPRAGIVRERQFYAQTLAMAGKFESARALIDKLEKDLREAHLPPISVKYAKGVLAYAMEDYRRAIEYLEPAAEALPSFYIQYWLGRSYLAAGELRQAIEVFEKQISTYNPGWRLSLGIWSVQMHFYLAQAYEQSGWTKDAITQYEIFLDWWSNADPDTKLVDEARNNLARLKQIL